MINRFPLMLIYFFIQAASALYFRRIFTTDLPSDTPDPEKYTRLVRFMFSRGSEVIFWIL